VMGRLGDRVVTMPSSPMLISTCLSTISGTTSEPCASSESLPRSTSCMAAAPVTALVIEAIQSTLSCASTPAAPSKITPLSVAAATTTPGTSPPATDSFSLLAISMSPPFGGRLGETRRLVDQLLSRDIQQFVLGGAVQDAFLADLEQHRHSERRDAVEPAVFDAALGAPQKIAQALQVSELVRRVLARGAQQDVVGLVLAQRIVDQVGAEGDLAARLLLPRKAPLDQAGDYRHVAKRAPQHRRLVHPGFEVIAQHVLV